MLWCDQKPEVSSLGTQENVGIAPVENHVPLRSDAKRIVSLTLNTQCQFVRSPGHSSGLQWSLLGLHASSHHREGGRECVDIGDDVTKYEIAAIFPAWTLSVNCDKYYDCL